ncbi:SDR family oxidoreductase [Streptomyces goshikiensis]|uniref:SDR family oxidoreductase n=1 Tax=Streptomyces goshikiensis TaxID=1942 RepID=UPI003657FC37
MAVSPGVTLAATSAAGAAVSPGVTLAATSAAGMAVSPGVTLAATSAAGAAAIPAAAPAVTSAAGMAVTSASYPAAGNGLGAVASWAELAARWVGGASVDWAARWPAPPRVVAFPGHPQQRRRIWWQPATPVPAPLAVPESVTVSLDVLGEAIRGHHVGGRRILPGAAVPELVRTALPGLSGAAARFGDLTWHRPLDLDRTAEVRVVVGDHRPGEPVPFTLTDPDGVVHATGTALALPGPALPSAAVPAPEQVGSAVAPAVVYARLGAGGVRHGSGLQVLQALWAGPGECLADLAAPPAAPGVLLDPVVLDGALQALAVLDDTTGYLPTAFAELTAGRPLPARCRVHARDVTPPGTTGSRTVDLDLFDGAEHVLALRGLTLTAVGAPTARPDTDREEPAEPAVTIRHRRPRWQPAGPPEPGRPPVHRVLLHCEDDQALRAALAAELDRRGIASDTGSEGDGAADAVLHLCPAAEPDLAAQLHDGFDSALRLATRHLGEGRDALRMLVVHRSDALTGQARPAYAATGALLRTLALEHSGFSGANVRVDGSPAGLARLLVDELLGGEGGDVRLTAEGRRVRTYEEYEPAPAAAAPAPAGDSPRTYLITGGAGRIGTTIAAHLAGRGHANLVLCGRRAADDTVEEALRELSATGAQVTYRQCDVSDRRQVDALVAEIRERFGALHGIVHAAGVTRDSRAVRKTRSEIAEVLAPKVWGAVHLDAATRHEPLEFLALFSSVAATTGNLGQADYAFANAFLDAFAEERAALHTAGRRPGRTVSIGWPLWANGGMPVHEASRLDGLRHEVTSSSVGLIGLMGSVGLMG